MKTKIEKTQRYFQNIYNDLFTVSMEINLNGIRMYSI